MLYLKYRNIQNFNSCVIFCLMFLPSNYTSNYDLVEVVWSLYVLTYVQIHLTPYVKYNLRGDFLKRNNNKSEIT